MTMGRRTLGSAVWILTCFVGACGAEVTTEERGFDAGVPGDRDGGAGRPIDGGRTPDPDAGPVPDGGGDRPDGTMPRACPPDPSLGRGLRWIRANPMFISGLTVSMGAPSRAFVDAYFDDFRANAVHLWEDGLPAEVDGWQAARAGAPFVSWVHKSGISHANRELIGGLSADRPGRIGYQVGDEPLSMSEYLEIEEGLRAVRDADPNALRIVNFSYRATDFGAILDRYCASGLGDVVSYDRYSRGRSELETLEQIRAFGLRCGIPYWRYIESYERDGAAVQTESDLRWSALIGLVYGYTGHTWFLYQTAPAHGLGVTFFERAGDFTAARTPRFEVAATLNRQMAVYGRAITRLTSTDVRYLPAIRGIVPDGTTQWSAGAGGDTFITGIEAVDGEPLQEGIVGFFDDDCGDTYVMLQNMNHADGSFPFESTRAATFRIAFDLEGAAGVDRDRLVALDAGGAGRLRDLPLAGEGNRRSVMIRLEAGDAVLFKYATGRPFVGFE
jgi:hypothetical protein